MKWVGKNNKINYVGHMKFSSLLRNGTAKTHFPSPKFL